MQNNEELILCSGRTKNEGMYIRQKQLINDRYKIFGFQKKSRKILRKKKTTRKKTTITKFKFVMIYLIVPTDY